MKALVDEFVENKCKHCSAFGNSCNNLDKICYINWLEDKIVEQEEQRIGATDNGR